MSVVTLEAKITNKRPMTTWLAAFGLSFFQSPIMGQDDPIYIKPRPRKPMTAAMGAMVCAAA